jgi:hypothetical protein
MVDLSARVALAILAAALLRPSPSVAQSVSLAPSTMPRIGSVSERYQSYNVEMIEVTGGRFWKPYGTEPDAAGPQPAPAVGTEGAEAPDAATRYTTVTFGRRSNRITQASLSP